jgi:hypothetical protein
VRQLERLVAPVAIAAPRQPAPVRQRHARLSGPARHVGQQAVQPRLGRCSVQPALSGPQRGRQIARGQVEVEQPRQHRVVGSAELVEASRERSRAAGIAAGDGETLRAREELAVIGKPREQPFGEAQRLGAVIGGDLGVERDQRECVRGAVVGAVVGAAAARGGARRIGRREEVARARGEPRRAAVAIDGGCALAGARREIRSSELARRGSGPGEHVEIRAALRERRHAREHASLGAGALRRPRAGGAPGGERDLERHALRVRRAPRGQRCQRVLGVGEPAERELLSAEPQPHRVVIGAAVDQRAEVGHRERIPAGLDELRPGPGRSQPERRQAARCDDHERRGRHRRDDAPASSITTRSHG